MRRGIAGRAGFTLDPPGASKVDPEVGAPRSAQAEQRDRSVCVCWAQRVDVKESCVPKPIGKGSCLAGNPNNAPNLATVRRSELACLKPPEGLKGFACP